MSHVRGRHEPGPQAWVGPWTKSENCIACHSRDRAWPLPMPISNYIVSYILERLYGRSINDQQHAKNKQTKTICYGECDFY